MATGTHPTQKKDLAIIPVSSKTFLCPNGTSVIVLATLNDHIATSAYGL